MFHTPNCTRWTHSSTFLKNCQSCEIANNQTTLSRIKKEKKRWHPCEGREKKRETLTQVISSRQHVNDWLSIQTVWSRNMCHFLPGNQEVDVQPCVLTARTWVYIWFPYSSSWHPTVLVQCFRKTSREESEPWPHAFMRNIYINSNIPITRLNILLISTDERSDPEYSLN